tara:strand:+ start:149 stop:442 length:294 start_codon:yes stop_codon:yes gene_type:complete
MPFFVKTEIIKKEYLIKKDLRNKVINDHIDWIKKLKLKGVNIKSGFLVDELQIPGAGGLLIIETKNFKEAMQIIKNDPMIISGIVDWKLHEWIDINQ